MGRLTARGARGNGAGIAAAAGIVLILALAVLAGGCSQPARKVIFRCDGGWYMPPAFHGNPYVAGGDGTHMHFIWNRLFLYIPATDRYIPRLGLSYRFSADRRVLTVTLRQGVVWHDGTPFTAMDVKTTFMVKYASGWGDALREIEVPDDHTVVFKRRQSFGSIDEKIIFNERIMAPEHLYGAYARAADKILVQAQEAPLYADGLFEADLEKRTAVNLKKADLMQKIYKFRPKTPVGTGPFKFSFVSASDLAMERFDRHWEADNISVDEVRMLKGVSNDMLWAYLISGEIDGSHPTTTQDVTEQILKLNPAIKLILAPEYGDIGFIINTTRPPMSHPAFRRALAHAVDKDKVRMISYYYSVTAGPYTTGVIESLEDKYLAPAAKERMTPYEFNVLQARHILDDAGFPRGENGYYTEPDGSPIELEVAAVAGCSDMVLACESLSNQLDILGIRSKIRAFEASLYHQQLTTNDFDIAANFGCDYRGYAHPAPSFDRFFGTSGYIKVASGLPDRLNNAAGKAIDVTRAVRDLYRLSDPEKIKATVGELAWIANEQLPYLSMYEKRLMVFVTDGERVTGWPAGDDPIWSASSTGLESVFCYLIASGTVKGVRP